MATVIACVVEKGGAGKTTTTGNLAAAVAAGSQPPRVLCIDWDPQANLTEWLVPKARPRDHVANVAAGGIRPEAAVHQTPWGFDVLAGHRELAGRIAVISPEMQNYVLRQVLEPLRRVYDWIFVDCPSRLDVLSIGALAAADYVLIPIELARFASTGLTNTLDAVRRARLHLNTGLGIAGIVANRADLRTKQQSGVMAALRRLSTEQHIRVFEPPIPDSIVVSEVCFKNVPIQYYRTRNSVARQSVAAYSATAQQLLTDLGGERNAGRRQAAT